MSDPAGSGIAVAVCTHRRARSLRRLLDSLVLQRPRPDELVIVDGSPDDETERMLAAYAGRDALAARVRYTRVGAAQVGLTRQRNAALDAVESELVAFFDDDVVLLPECLATLADAHRTRDGVVGVAALIANEQGPPRFAWRVRRALGVVTTLAPGRYCASGMSTPWRFAAPQADALVEGDWLPGGATMWRTGVARELGFAESFGGYASGEDLEFSLRARRRGRLLLATAARVLHLHEPGGRPDPYRLAYSTVRNRHRIHAASPYGARLTGRLHFAYASAVGALCVSAGLARAGRPVDACRYMQGVLRFAGDRAGAAAPLRQCPG